MLTLLVGLLAVGPLTPPDLATRKAVYLETVIAATAARQAAEHAFPVDRASESLVAARQLAQRRADETERRTRAFRTIAKTRALPLGTIVNIWNEGQAKDWPTARSPARR